MKFSSKTTTTAIALFLMLTVTIVALPIANAQIRKKTYPFIGAVPNPVGVGQEVLLHVGITDNLETADQGWEGLSITIERPDGQTDTIDDIKTDSTGGTGRMYVPDIEGTYYVQGHFPEQVCEDGVAGFFGVTILPGTTMEESDSEVLELIVTAEPIEIYPAHPLPTEYWTRPIDAQQREWAQVSGSWLETPDNKYAPYNDAPETAHVLWTKPFTTGGVAGGALDNGAELTDHAFECGDAYEGKFGAGFFGGGNPLIIAGKLYYEKYAGNDDFKETACVDLHTGEELWSRPLLDNRTFTRGQLMYWDSYDYHGVYDYLIAQVGGGFFDPTPPSWHFFDPWTGDWVYALTNIPSGSMTRSAKGEFLIYTVDRQNGWMTMWNSSNIPQLYASTQLGSMGIGQWQPMGKTVGATDPVLDWFGNPVVTPQTPFGVAGIQWNETIPQGLAGGVIGIMDDRIVGGSVSRTEVSLWGLNIDPNDGAIGRVIFENTWTAPSEWETGSLSISTAGISSVSEGGIVALYSKEERKHYGFSTEDGTYLWVTDEPEHYLNIYTPTVEPAISYDNELYYNGGAGGVLYCYDAQTGDRLWKYHANDPYSEILWANDWWLSILFISDGKIYLGHEEHSPIDPKPRGAPFTCLNATTGEEIWRINGAFRQTHWGGHALIGDGIIATQDTYNQRVWAIGKGPSETKVSIQNDVITHGDSVLVKGMVTDVSPGTNDAALTMRFPNGVPAVCDANMSDWMLYVYKQFARPADVMGVEVVVSVLDPNGNAYEVGTTTSDASGFFKLMFTPLVPGEYTVIATFEGSEAYYGSFAETAVGVVEAPAATPEPTPEPATAADLYFLPMSIGTIIAVIVVLVLLVLMMFRKR